jgi:hypothetical protein
MLEFAVQTRTLDDDDAVMQVRERVSMRRRPATNDFRDR